MFKAHVLNFKTSKKIRMNILKEVQNDVTECSAALESYKGNSNLLYCAMCMCFLLKNIFKVVSSLSYKILQYFAVMS